MKGKNAMPPFLQPFLHMDSSQFALILSGFILKGGFDKSVNGLIAFFNKPGLNKAAKNAKNFCSIFVSKPSIQYARRRYSRRSRATR